MPKVKTWLRHTIGYPHLCGEDAEDIRGKKIVKGKEGINILGLRSQSGGSLEPDQVGRWK